ncbi:MAG: glycosyltransferase family 2 protein [Flavobacteriales bacterium]|nr:glycosyltransferase family 2 protein [Flavobacteriales bacterium]
MLKGKTVAVVVPCYNEESQIGLVIDTMPDFVDRIVVVNDCSPDRTAEVVKELIARDRANREGKRIPPYTVERTRWNEAELVLQEESEREMAHYVPSEVVNEHPETDRIILINNLKNGGVGAGIARGYKWCQDHAIACTAVMAGDGQMDPHELESICLPVIEEGIDYVKGNRLIHRSAWLVIPRVRFFGNSILSILTKLASGYWRVSDTQTGYTAIGLRAMQAIKLHKIYRSYGMPNDMLVKLNIAQCTLREVEIKPVYRVGEQSKMKVMKVIPRVSRLLIKSFFIRLWRKYLFKDFHPLFIFYNYAFVAGLIALPYLWKIGKAFVTGTTVNTEPLIAFLFLATSSFQALIFAMWMDMQDNERLYR